LSYEFLVELWEIRVDGITENQTVSIVGDVFCDETFLIFREDFMIESAELLVEFLSHGCKSLQLLLVNF
jgi:hypothetical protein